jgi:mannan endo-1,4-beta-mannosidase
MTRYFVFSIVTIIFAFSAAVAQPNSFISTKDQTFQLNSRPYYFIGANYWYGSLLGLENDRKRGVERLRKELDFLKKNGVTNLRLMAGSEGSGTINGVERVGPPLQPVQGKFDASALDGLDLILSEMRKRNMSAVIFLSNNWEWSGGFQQYVDWNGLVPDEMRTRRLNWDELRDMVARFYICFECKAGYRKQVEYVLSRTNKITNQKYVDDPTIMAWEIANEPRPMRPGARERYVEWIGEVAAAVKALDRNHLVTIGGEGSIGTEGIPLFETIHAYENIDYLTIHIWAKNWGWFADGKLTADFPSVMQKASAYIEEHVAVAARLNKPLVIEEFGLPRDPVNAPSRLAASAKTTTAPAKMREEYQSLQPASSTSLRDNYFRKIFSYVGTGAVAGANFWAFGGGARPVNGQAFWKKGDEWMGDPPMEEQGLNTVFDEDRSTWNVIKAARSAIKNKN